MYTLHKVKISINKVENAHLRIKWFQMTRHLTHITTITEMLWRSVRNKCTFISECICKTPSYNRHSYITSLWFYIFFPGYMRKTSYLFLVSKNLSLKGIYDISERAVESGYICSDTVLSDWTQTDPAAWDCSLKKQRLGVKLWPSFALEDCKLSAKKLCLTNFAVYCLHIADALDNKCCQWNMETNPLGLCQ